MEIQDHYLRQGVGHRNMVYMCSLPGTDTEQGIGKGGFIYHHILYVLVIFCMGVYLHAPCGPLCYWNAGRPHATGNTDVASLLHCWIFLLAFKAIDMMCV